MWKVRVKSNDPGAYYVVNKSLTLTRAFTMIGSKKLPNVIEKKPYLFEVIELTKAEEKEIKAAKSKEALDAKKAEEDQEEEQPDQD